MSKTITFENEKELAHYLLNETLPYCSNYYERMLAAVYAAKKARELRVKYAR